MTSTPTSVLALSNPSPNNNNNNSIEAVVDSLSPPQDQQEYKRRRRRRWKTMAAIIVVLVLAFVATMAAAWRVYIGSSLWAVATGETATPSYSFVERIQLEGDSSGGRPFYFPVGQRPWPPSNLHPDLSNNERPEKKSLSFLSSLFLKNKKKRTTYSSNTSRRTAAAAHPTTSSTSSSRHHHSQNNIIVSPGTTNSIVPILLRWPLHHPSRFRSRHTTVATAETSPTYSQQQQIGDTVAYLDSVPVRHRLGQLAKFLVSLQDAAEQILLQAFRWATHPVVLLDLALLLVANAIASGWILIGTTRGGATTRHGIRMLFGTSPTTKRWLRVTGSARRWTRLLTLIVRNLKNPFKSLFKVVAAMWEHRSRYSLLGDYCWYVQTGGSNNSGISIGSVSLHSGDDKELAWRRYDDESSVVD